MLAERARVYVVASHHLVALSSRVRSYTALSMVSVLHGCQRYHLSGSHLRLRRVTRGGSYSQSARRHLPAMESGRIVQTTVEGAQQTTCGIGSLSGRCVGPTDLVLEQV